MVPSDIVFLTGDEWPVETRRNMVEQYLAKFDSAQAQAKDKDKKPNKEVVLARELLKNM
jgi:hypothetical protein